MKKLKKLFFIIAILSVSSSCSKANISLTASEVFECVKYNVVEIKSYTDGKRICYGSAVLIDDNGVFVSNAHLVRYKEGGVYYEYSNIEIRFAFEENYRKVTLQKYNPDLDISFLVLDDISNLDLKPISLGTTQKIKHGQKVYAIGNGMNHGIGITEGIVSLPEVKIIYEDIEKNVIQCNLIINDGNSGGALVNEQAELIGITTFRLKDNSGSIIYGVAFCVPIKNVIEFYNN